MSARDELRDCFLSDSRDRFEAAADKYRAEVLEEEKARADRLEIELTQVRGALRKACDHVAELEDQIGELSAKVYAASTVKCWTNEDGQRFVFAKDLAAALGYGPRGGA